VLLLTVILLSAVCMLMYAGNVAAGVKSGLEYAAKILIPSLFPFMVLSSFLIRSGSCDIIGKRTDRICRCIFGLPGETLGAVALSFIGGFPVGARNVRLLYEKGTISIRQAEQMMLYCVCSGPAFLITGVGTLLLHNSQAGVILYVSQLVSGLLIAVITGQYYKKSHFTGKRKGEILQKSRQAVSDQLIISCSDAAQGILQLTALVSAFSAIIAICEASGIQNSIKSLLKMCKADYPIAENALYILTEVTTACGRISSGGCPLWLLSFAVGFGGLCVHFQIFALLGDIPIHKGRFFLFRLINALLSSVIVCIIGRFYEPTEMVFAVGQGIEAEWVSVTAVGTAAMLIMSVIFVLSLKRRKIQ